MNARTLRFLPVVMLAACAANDGSDSAPSTNSGARVTTVDSWVDRKSQDLGFVTDASGNLVPKSDKRSSFDSQRESPYFKQRQTKKIYQTGDYAKKSWWGNKEYRRPAYAGNTDGSRFAVRSAAQGRDAREANNAFGTPTFETDRHPTAAAREAGSQRIERVSDAETDFRRRVFTAPAVSGWEEHRKVNPEQMSQLLGR